MVDIIDRIGLCSFTVNGFPILWLPSTFFCHSSWLNTCLGSWQCLQQVLVLRKNPQVLIPRSHFQRLVLVLLQAS